MEITERPILHPEDLVIVEIPEKDMDLLTFNSKEAEIGGSSQIPNRQGEERDRNLSDDQLVGQLGNYAGIKYLLDSIEPYKEIREIANRNKYQGDKGCDIPGYRIDTKCSRMKRSKDPFSYRLSVRPKEKHANWVYVLALVPNLFARPLTVILVGWYEDWELPKEIDKWDDDFKGAHIEYGLFLHPMADLKRRLAEFPYLES